MLFFDYFDKSLILLSVTTGRISVASFATVIGAPVGVEMASASFSLGLVIYLLMVQKLLNSKQNILKLQHIRCV